MCMKTRHFISYRINTYRKTGRGCQEPLPFPAALIERFLPSCFPRCSGMNPPKCRQAAFRGFHLGIVAAFLFDQVVFDPACAFGRREESLPRANALAKQDAIALFRRPILTMHRANSPGVALNP